MIWICSRQNVANRIKLAVGSAFRCYVVQTHQPHWHRTHKIIIIWMNNCVSFVNETNVLFWENISKKSFGRQSAINPEWEIASGERGKAGTEKSHQENKTLSCGLSMAAIAIVLISFHFCIWILLHSNQSFHSFVGDTSSWIAHERKLCEWICAFFSARSFSLVVDVCLCDFLHYKST